MSNSASSTWIISVPGTQDTQELSREAVIEAVQRGALAPDHWVWSPEHNEWKPLSEIPELQPESEPEPESPPTTPSVFMNGQVPPAIDAAQFAASVGQPATFRQPAAVARQSVSVAANSELTQSQQLARTQFSQPMEVKHEFPIFKVLFFISFLAVAAILGGNYFLVYQPFATNLASTSFASAPVYAHLAAFLQPNALVIHIRPSPQVTAANFADFLAAVAKSTPPQPFNSSPFTGVGITSTWQSQYAINGLDWQKLGQMDGASATEKQQFIVEHFLRIDGTPLVAVHHNEDPDALAKATDKAWQDFTADFVPKN
jgi:hypothetical protein